MNDLPGTAKVIHEALVGETIDGDLRGFVRDRQNKLVRFSCCWLVFILAQHIQITAASRINVMEHLAYLSIALWSLYARIRPTDERLLGYCTRVGGSRIATFQEGKVRFSQCDSNWIDS